MRRWLRATLPPDASVGLLVSVYAFFEFLPRAFGLPMHGGELIIPLAVIAYAGYRVTAFHPVFVPEYRTWLETTPWTSRLPLPVGAVHLVPQDVILLGLLMGLAWLEHPGFDVLSIPMIFLAIYEVFMALSFVQLRMPWFAYAILFGLGLMCLYWAAPLVALKIGVALYSISYLGLRRSLNEFHLWANADWLGDRQYHTLTLEKRVELMKQKILGWPFDVIRPKEIAGALRYRDGIMLSLLVGWWAFVLIQRLKALVPNLEPVPFFVGLVCHIAVIIRLATYCWGYLPPISFWGRVLTLRWIIPGYDRVFVAPLSALLVMVGGLIAYHRWGVALELAAPATLTLVLLLLLNLGPSLAKWRLTGRHRLSPSMLMVNSQAEVKQL